MTTLLRRRAAGAVTAALILAVSACGGGSDGSDSAGSDGGTPVNDKTANLAVLTKSDFSDVVTQAQQQAKSGHIEATLDAAGQTGKISADVAGLGDPANLTMAMTVGFGGRSLDLRLVDKVLYLKGVNSNPAKPWVQIDLSDRDNPLTTLFDQANPESFTAYLRSVQDLQDKGVETVDGVQTRHYVITIDTAKAMAASPATKGTDVSKLGLPAKLSPEVWVDTQNRPVRMLVALGNAGSVDVHFSDFGKKVSVSAPPAAKVSEFTAPSMGN